jgi:hypothetical protein
MLWIVLVSLGLQAREAPREPVAVPAHVLEAHRWALQTYSQLNEHRMAIQVEGDARTQRIEIDEAAGDQRTRERTRSPLLLIDARFTQTGALEFLSARGPAVSTPKLDALRVKVAARSNWTDAEIDAEVRAVGGSFGPLARAALLERAQRLADTRKEAAPIVWTAFERTESHGPVWVVDVQGARRVLRALYEPFTGQLIAVFPR